MKAYYIFCDCARFGLDRYNTYAEQDCWLYYALHTRRPLCAWHSLSLSFSLFLELDGMECVRRREKKTGRHSPKDRVVAKPTATATADTTRHVTKKRSSIMNNFGTAIQQKNREIDWSNIIIQPGKQHQPNREQAKATATFTAKGSGVRDDHAMEWNGTKTTHSKFKISSVRYSTCPSHTTPHHVVVCVCVCFLHYHTVSCCVFLFLFLFLGYIMSWGRRREKVIKRAKKSLLLFCPCGYCCGC